MAHRTREESNSVPVQETLDNPHPSQRWPASSPLLLGRVSEGQQAHLVLQKIIEAVGNVSLAIATLFSYLFVAAMEILKVLSVRKDKTRERDEVKTKVEEIKYAKPKEIEHHKWKLEEQVFFSVVSKQFCLISR